MKRWLYKLYKLRTDYTLDKEGMVAVIRTNKPVEVLEGEEAEAMQTLMEHFSGRGYHVIVR